MAEKTLDPATFDRTDLTIRHEGPLVLPHDIIFHRLHFLALNSNTSAVKDAARNLDASYQQLLTDVVATRNRIRATIKEKTLQSIYDERENSFVVTAHGYEFVVIFLAVLALGGIVVPTSIHITKEELNHVLRVSKASATVCSAEYLNLASSVSPATGMEEEYVVVSVGGLVNSPLINPRSMAFSSGKTPDPNRPGLIIFTSGSTGPPKGAALRRYNLFVLSSMQCWNRKIEQGYVALNMLPTHHVTGLLINTLPVLIGGGCVEFTHPKFDAAKIWERIRLGGIKNFSAVPTIYVRLVKHWETVIQKLQHEERESYQAAISRIEQFHCGSAALQMHVSKKWTEICRGRQIAERYGGTEFGNPFAHDSQIPRITGSVGGKNPGIESYLENGDEGEIFVRSPFLFSKYVNNIEGTKASLTDDGFFRTGDVAEKRGDKYFIKGRKSIDIIKSGGYKISAVDVERHILEHPKVAEAIVVGLEDVEYGQRIAAAVVLNEGVESLSLTELRRDLRVRLSTYKLPTVLRVVPQLRKTDSLKVPKLLLKKELFGCYDHTDIQKWAASDSKL